MIGRRGYLRVRSPLPGAQASAAGEDCDFEPALMSCAAASRASRGGAGCGALQVLELCMATFADERSSFEVVQSWISLGMVMCVTVR